MIYGKRIRLRGVERSDVAAFYHWINDLEVIAGITIFLPMSMTDEEKWFEGTIQRPQEEKPLAIEMKDGDAWRLIGNSGFFDFDWFSRSAEVGILIGDKSVWDQGYGTETMGLLLRHAFETLNLRRVTLRVYADNGRAIRTYEKVGFVHEGSMRQAVYKNGKYHDILIMSVLRSDWDAKEEK